MHNEYFAQEIIDRSRQPVLYVEFDGRVLFANSAALQWLTIDREALIGNTLEQVDLCSEFKKQIVAMTADIVSSNKDTQLVRSIPHINQSGLAILRAMRVDSASSDTQSSAIAFIIDCDADEQIFNKIMIDNMLKYCEDMIYFKDLDSRFIRCSESAAEQFGAPSRDSVRGKSDFDFFDHEAATQFYDCEQEIIRTGNPWVCKPEKTEGGKAGWVLSSKMPLRDGAGNIVGTFGISKDITAQKEFETELEQTHKKLVSTSRQAGMAEIATNVIHNVGNVLNSVNVSISQVQEVNRELKIDNLHKVAEMISENANVENYLTEDEKGKRIPEYLSMLAAELLRDREEIQAELNATKRHLDHIKTIVTMQQEYATSSTMIEKVDLSKLLYDAIQISSSSMARHNIELVKNFEDSIVVSIDQHQVLQILINLIRNAKHACQAVDRPNKRIVASVESTDSEVKISISDNGIGISQENLRELFRHGFTTKAHGHGFGLHSGANAAKQMGGSLQGFSDGIGAGAQFVLTLPLQTAANEPVMN